MAPKRKRKDTHSNASSKTRPDAENATTKAEPEQKLPPLLRPRNTICEYALVEATPTSITAALRPPSLLQTCQQIRREATLIWFLQNDFCLDIVDCDATLLAKIDKLGKEIYKRSDTAGRLGVQSTVTGASSWSNLMLWCEAMWKDDITFLQPDDRMSQYERVIAGAHAITTRCRNENREWEDCKKTLEDLKFAVDW